MLELVVLAAPSELFGRQFGLGVRFVLLEADPRHLVLEKTDHALVSSLLRRPEVLLIYEVVVPSSWHRSVPLRGCQSPGSLVLAARVGAPRLLDSRRATELILDVSQQHDLFVPVEISHELLVGQLVRPAKRLVCFLAQLFLTWGVLDPVSRLLHLLALLDTVPFAPVNTAIGEMAAGLGLLALRFYEVPSERHTHVQRGFVVYECCIVHPDVPLSRGGRLRQQLTIRLRLHNRAVPFDFRAQLWHAFGDFLAAFSACNGLQERRELDILVCPDESFPRLSMSFSA